MTYTLHGPKGRVGKREDLFVALKLARAMVDGGATWVDVRDERGLSLGVACGPSSNAAAIMARARKRNFELQAGQAAPKAPTRKLCGDKQIEHDWIHFELHADRLYRCRMCDVIGYMVGGGGGVKAHSCNQCQRGAVSGLKLPDRKHIEWRCHVHAR